MNNNYIVSEIRKLSNLIRRKTFLIECDKSVEKAVGTQGFIIKFLYDNSCKDIFQKDIEKQFKVRRSTVTSAIKRMEKAGFIKRESVKSDSRLKKLTLTEKGVNLHKYIEQRIKETEILLESSLTINEKEKFIEIINKLQKVVE